MVAYGARGNTAKQMRSVLALPEKDELAKSGFQAFVDSFKVRSQKVKPKEKRQLGNQFNYFLFVRICKQMFCSFFFQNYKQVDLRLANKVFLNEGVKPKAEFNAMTKEGFRSEPQNVNFAKSTEAAKTINDWCEAQTNNRIKNLIKSGETSPPSFSHSFTFFPSLYLVRETFGFEAQLWVLVFRRSWFRWK